MENPFQEMSELCHAYLAAHTEFTALRDGAQQCEALASGSMTAEQYQSEAVIAQARISLVTPLNDHIAIEVPVTRNLLHMALAPVSSRLAELVERISVTSREAVERIKQCQVKQPTSSTTMGQSQNPPGSPN